MRREIPPGAPLEAVIEAVSSWPRVVIESPYAGDVERNIAYARACARDVIARGEVPYASHIFFTQPDLLDDKVEEERNLGISLGFAWAASADLRAFYVDHGMSRGMEAGLTEARRLGQAFAFRRLH